MRLRLVESGVAAGFGALDAAVTAKAGTTGWGGAGGVLNQKWSLVLELAGLAAGAFGSKVGISEEVRTPLAYSSLTLLGQRGARYAMAGKIFQPGSWQGQGGDEGGDGDNVLNMAGGASQQQRSARHARGGFPTDARIQELPGVAG